MASIVRRLRSRGGEVASFAVALVQNILAIARGSATPTFTRATTAYQTDFEGKLNLVPSGAVRMQGARFVSNLIPAAGAGSASLAAAANKTVTVGVGTFVFSMGAVSAADTVITFTGTATGLPGTTLTANATKRTSVAMTITVGGTVIMTASENGAVDLQFENTTGQTNQNPSEYVSVGVLSAPYHGAGVDGVKYFSTLNGNTVASNVVTETTGAAISSSEAACADGVTAGVVDASGPIGFLPEVVRTQYLGVTGTPATQTTASLVTGTYCLWIEDGDTGSATSSAGTATITGGGAATDGTPNVFTVTGAGTVTVTVAGSVSYFNLQNVGFRLSRIDNANAAGTSVQQNADVLDYVSAGNIAPVMTLALDWTPEAAGTGAVVFLSSQLDGNNYILIYHDGTNYTVRSRVAGTFYTCTKTLSYVAGTTYRLVARFGTTNSGWVDGAKGTDSAAATTAVTGTTFYLGSNTGVTQANGAIRNLVIKLSYLSDAEAAAL